MRKFMRLMVRFVRTRDWSKEFHAMLLVALVVTGCLIIEVGKRQDAELERQRVQELLEIERDERYNDSLVN